MAMGIRSTRKAGGGGHGVGTPTPPADPNCGRCGGDGLQEIEHGGSLPIEQNDYGDGRLNHSTKKTSPDSYSSITRCGCGPPRWGLP